MRVVMTFNDDTGEGGLIMIRGKLMRAGWMRLFLMTLNEVNDCE